MKTRWWCTHTACVTDGGWNLYRTQMTVWVANKLQALRAQCRPFIQLLIINATVWLRDFKLSLIAIYILIGHHAYFQLKRYSSIFKCVWIWRVLSVLQLCVSEMWTLFENKKGSDDV